MAGLNWNSHKYSIKKYDIILCTAKFCLLLRGLYPTAGMSNKLNRVNLLRKFFSTIVVLSLLYITSTAQVTQCNVSQISSSRSRIVRHHVTVSSSDCVCSLSNLASCHLFELSLLELSTTFVVLHSICTEGRTNLKTIDLISNNLQRVFTKIRDGSI